MPLCDANMAHERRALMLIRDAARRMIRARMFTFSPPPGFAALRHATLVFMRAAS